MTDTLLLAVSADHPSAINAVVLRSPLYHSIYWVPLWPSSNNI